MLYCPVPSRTGRGKHRNVRAMNRTPRPRPNRGSDWWVRVLRGWASNVNLRRRHMFGSALLPFFDSSFDRVTVKNHRGTLFFCPLPGSVMRSVFSDTYQPASKGHPSSIPIEKFVAVRDSAYSLCRLLPLSLVATASKHVRWSP